MSEMLCSVVIRDRSGRQHVYPLAKGETTLGCDVSSKICVPNEPALLPGHVLLVPQGEQCWVSTVPGAGLQSETGEKLEAGFLPWGARLYLGQLEIQLQRTENTKEAQKPLMLGNPSGGTLDTGGTSGTKHLPVIFMLLVCTIAFAVNAFGSDGRAGTGLPSKEISLFAESRQCISGNQGHRASVAEHAAQAKSERSVFAAQDGIAAVALFDEAASCFEQAGDPQRAAHARQAADSLRKRMTEQYRVTRLRLERALEAEDTRTALEQVALLQELLRHQEGSDLSLSLRRLALRLSKETSP